MRSISIADNQTIDVSIQDYALRDPLLFGDYRNVINKNEPRFYEDLLDYEAIYFLFQEVSTLLYVCKTFSFLSQKSICSFLIIPINIGIRLCKSIMNEWVH